MVRWTVFPAKIGGLIWLAVGIVLLAIRKLAGRSSTLNLDEAGAGH